MHGPMNIKFSSPSWQTADYDEIPKPGVRVYALQEPPLAHKPIEMYPPYVYSPLRFGTQTPVRASDIPSPTPVQTDTRDHPAHSTMCTVVLAQGQSCLGLPFIAHPYLAPRLSGVTILPYVPA